MKVKSFALLVLSSTVALNSYSQTTEVVPSEKGIFLSEAYISFGGQRSDLNNESWLDFAKLAPNGELKPNEDMNKKSSDDLLYGYNSFFHLGLGFNFRDNEAPGGIKNVTLRAGFTYVNSYGFDGSWENKEVYTYDTLISKSTGRQYIMDSTYTEKLNFEYSYEQIRLDVAVLFRTNTESKFSFFGGVGINTGVSINSTTDVTYNEYSTINKKEFDDDPFTRNFYFDEADNTETESFSNKMNYTAAVYIPIGVDFRFANNHQFWKMVHIFYEMRPSMNYFFVPELGSNASALFSNNLGMRIKFS